MYKKDGCLYCQKKLLIRFNNLKYCSNECRVKFNNLQKKNYHKNIEGKRKWRNEHYNRRKEWFKFYRNKKRKELRMKVLTHYGGEEPKCACCGYSGYEFLAMDHVMNDGAEHRKKVSAQYFYQWLVRNNYPAGFQVLCHNCNNAKAFYGLCPHSK